MPGYLKVRRPSPTTASFTVSNASQCTSTPAKALSHLQFLLRAFIFVTVLAVCAARLRSSFFAEDGSWVRWTAVWTSPFGELACRIADSYSPLVVTVVSVVAMYGVFRKGYTGAFYLGGTVEIWIQRLTMIAGYRRVASCHTGSGDSDVYFFEYVSVQGHDAVYSYRRDSGYCDS